MESGGEQTQHTKTQQHLQQATTTTGNTRKEERMPRTPAKKTKKAAPSHPPYADMVKAAIVALKDRTGSSAVAIAKYLDGNYKLPETYKKSLSLTLKKLVESGKLVKVKASYKLGSLKTEPKKKDVKKKTTAAKKKTTAAKKKTAPKKKVAKKPKKPAAKKPKKAAPKKKTAVKKKIVKRKK